MTWQGIAGHDEIVEQFRRSLARGRLATTFLFVGPEGVGKHSFALKLAQALLCQARPAEELNPCGVCPPCLQVAAGTHPDLLRVARPEGKAEIPVRLLIGESDRRMQEGLCHDISLKPFMGGRRIAIIDEADYLNEEGANALLKTLEEPPPRSVMILVGTSVDRQLPTIRSRSQIVRFQPLAVEVLAELLLARGLAADSGAARRVAAQSEGSLARARDLADAELWAFRAQFLPRLAEPQLDAAQLAKLVSAFVDEAGKEAPARRARARQVVAFAVQFYRQVWRAADIDDEELARAVAAAVRSGAGDAELAAARAERSLEALAHIDRNANQANWIESWLDDLAQLGRPTVAAK